MATTPTLAEILDFAFKENFEAMNFCLPAKVERYDNTLQQVDAQPLLKKKFTDENGIIRSENLPVIPNIPVLFPGSNGFSVTFPVSKGDTVLLVFCDQSLDEWLSQDDTVDPKDNTRNSLTNAFAIVGLRSFKKPLASAPTDRMTLGKDNGTGINIDDNEVRLGANIGTQFVALANKVISELNILKNAYNSHTHGETGVTTLTPLPLLLPSFPGSVASDNVKAKG